MKNITRTITSALLALTMTLGAAAIPAAAAEGNTEQPDTSACVSEYAVSKDSLSDAETLEESEEAAPDGYALPGDLEKEAVPANKPVNKTDSESVGAGVTFSVSGETLTIAGSGSMKGLMNNDRSYPWSEHASAVKAVVIKSGVTDIYKYAFMGFQKLQTVTIPSTVTSIGEAAFYQCNALKIMVLPDSVKTIGSGAFYSCRALEQIQMNGVSEIGNYAFQGAAVRSVSIGKDVKSLTGLAFFGSALSSVSVNSGNTAFKMANGVLFSKDMSALVLYPPKKQGTSFKVPDSVKMIGECAFAKNTYLRSVDLSSVTFLGSSAFQECCALESIIIPNSVTDAYSFTFYKCQALKSVTFGSGLPVTSYQMFRGCTKLTSIVFAGLKEIEALTFADCSALETVCLSSAVSKIGNGCFGNCKSLISFSAPSLANIPYQAFLNDSQLTTIDLPNVKNIYRDAFLGCALLYEVDLPSSTEFVHSIAFEKNVKLICANKAIKPYGYNGLRTLQQISVSGDECYNEAFSVLTLVNNERIKQGVKPLVMNRSLLDTAMLRAAECAVCFSHTRPDGSTCLTANALISGENIAANQQNAAEVMDSWMGSSGHRSNILNADFTTIGIGCFKNNGFITWVQCFGTGSDASSCKQPADKNATYKLNLATTAFDEANDNTTGISFGRSQRYEYRFQIGFDDYSKKLEPGESAQARMYAGCLNGTYSMAVLDNVGIEWTSKNSDIAEITADGMVTAKAPGNAEIVAKLTYYKASDTVSVYQKTAAINKTELTENGIKVSWNECYGCYGYFIYFRPETEDKWDYYYTYEPCYELLNLMPGVRYYFQVRACQYSDEDDNYSKVASCVFEVKPSLSIQNTNAGLTATWKATGSDSYIVYYRSAEQTAWSSFTTTNTNTVIPETESGKLYCVQVQNVTGGKKGAYSKVKSMTYVDRTAITSVSYNGDNTLTWNAVGGANGYQIARKKIGETSYTYYTTDSTSFTEQNVTSGTAYTYQVRAMYKTQSSGTAYGAWSPSKSVVTIEKPELHLSNKKNGIRLEWNAAKGAVKYVVYYRKIDSKSWSSVTTANTYYPYLNVIEGQQYCFQIRAVDSNLNGPYSKVQSKVFYNPLKVKPEVTLTKMQNSLEANWNAVEGATKYTVYYRKSNVAQWLSTQVSDCGFTYPNTVKGTTYCVQVQPLFGNTKGAYSKVQRITF